MKHLADEEFTDHLLGETAPGRRKETAAHLHACPACRSRLAALRAAASAVAAVPPAPVSADFTAKLMARIGEGEKAAPAEHIGIFSWPAPWKLVFAACALMLFAAAFFRPGGAPVPATSRILYLADGPATPVRLAGLVSPAQPGVEAKSGGIYFSDSCRTAGCGL
ncbi:MAG: hypothetical protein Q7R35_14170 [Elusimicrobiota bacterium]|nr:hypothetical protein [Elusimicrobiota bacterium]